ncbi:MAG: peroxide stress protein YaaA [Nesterenkonia sp.]|nr:peroxide stress protein YaaA [Nesterenkonia sp.]
MLIYLPPSEGKTPPGSDGAAGAPVAPQEMFLPQLAQRREQVIDALIQTSQAPDAQQVLRVGATVTEEVRANLDLRHAPTAPAQQLYSGVLFDALDPQGLDTSAQARADESVLIFSGLFGVTGFSDRLPAHRLSMGVTLRPFGDDRDPGPLGSFWRRAMSEPLDDHVGDELVLDCRSSSYAAAHRPPSEQTVAVNSFTEADGARKVVTHFAKRARGELVGMLLRAEARAQSIDDVAEIAAERWEVEVRPAEGRRPHQLDLISAGE